MTLRSSSCECECECKMAQLSPPSTPQSAAPNISIASSSVDVSDKSALDCFAFFNPVSNVEYENTVNRWTDAILSLAKHIPQRMS